MPELGRLRGVRLLALDVDGVLTDGRLHYGPGGTSLSFHARDGLGIRRLRAAGVPVVALSGRRDEAARRRLEELGVDELLLGVDDKLAALRGLARRRGLRLEELAFLGDDLQDLPALRAVGFGAAVADAAPELRAAADWVTPSPGGRGAVRELCERLLSARGRVLGVIPARYASRRFPGKPLVPLRGVPLLLRVVERARRARSLDELLVATDDPRIEALCREHGVPCELTSSSHRTGSERVAEVARRHLEASLLVNVQGDEPLLDPELVDRLVEALRSDPALGLVTARLPLRDPAELELSQVVKVVADLRGRALYFSRAPLPALRDPGGGRPVYKHLGIYAYRREVLLRLAELTPTPLERAESLEQLRALEHGIPIGLVDARRESAGVDLPEDVARVEALLAREEGT